MMPGPEAELSPTDQRLLVAGACAAIATLLPVAAHQLGLLNHLPDPPSRIFASDHVTESKAAHPLGIPDSLLGLGSYGVTLTLALLAADSFRKLCSWCTGTAACTAITLFAARKLLLQEEAAVAQRLS
jgi:uncharacterized membrane protein